MNKSALISRVRAVIGDAAEEFTESEILDALNTAHRWTIPDATGEPTLATETSITLTASVDVYTLDESLYRAVRQKDYFLLGDDSSVAVYTDWSSFWSDYARDMTDATPTGVLVEGLRLTLRPAPDGAGTLIVPVYAYPSALGDDGISYHPRAFAACYLAAREIAVAQGYDAIVALADAEAERYLAAVRTRWLAADGHAIGRAARHWGVSL